MKSDLNQFIAKYISIAGAAFMSVTFVAFVTIPYNLDNPEGGLVTAQLSSSTSAQA